MQLIFQYHSWTIQATQGIVGRQYDNLAHSLVVEGELPSGYTWDMLVECQGHKNIIPLSPVECGLRAPLTANQLALDGYYAFQLRGTAATGGAIHHTNVASVYIPPTLVGPGTWPTLPTEFSQAEADIKELNAHPPVPGVNGFWMLWDLDTHSYVQSQLVVPGLHIEIGETTTGEPGTPASVTNSGTNTAPVLNFTIPEGEKGDAATIQVGEVTASDPGSEPQVKNSGTENAAVFDFVLPRGQTGPTGQAATIEVESTVTGEPGTQASVENVGTTGAAKLRFTIPRGNTGQNGVTPTLAAGNVETLDPDQPATASVTGEGPEYQINLGIPRGQTGAQGTHGKNGKDGQTPTISVGTVTTLDPGQDATAEITGETPNLVLSLGIPEGQPGQDGVQLNDNAVNATEAWSSKKIVDTLCPEFSVSGNPVVCHPVEGYPLSAVVTLEPKQAGSGDPSPENVRPISGWDEVTVTRCGKNLFGGEENLWLGQTGEQTIKGAYSSLLIPCKEGDVFTLSTSAQFAPTPGNIGCVGFYNLEYEVIARTANAYNKTLTVAAPSGSSYVRASCYHPDNDKIQFELGSTPTYYEPYQGDTYNNALPETVYGGTVDCVTGEGEKTWGFVELDGTENWDKYSNTLTKEPQYRANLKIDFPGIAEGSKRFCTHFSTSDYQSWAQLKSNTFATDKRFICIQLDYQTVEEFKSYLSTQYAAGTPVTVCYKLATPEPFQATGNQPLPAVDGLNTVYTDGDSLDVSGRQDLLYTLQTMQAQTQNLNRFIAEGGTQ